MNRFGQLLSVIILAAASSEAAAEVRQLGDFIEIEDAYVGSPDTHLLLRMSAITSVQYVPARNEQKKSRIIILYAVGEASHRLEIIGDSDLSTRSTYDRVLRIISRPVSSR